MALHIEEGNGSPIGAITPINLSQHYTDTANGHTWISTGLTDQDWVEVGSGTFAGDPEPKQAQDDRLEPSGFIRADLNTTGVMELSSDGTNISRIDKEKLLGITNYYTDAAADFATENSVMMTTLGYTTEQKIAFVNKAVAELEPIKKHIEMFSYYVIWDMFDAIVRDEILTEERITALKNGLYAKVFE